MVIKEFRHIIIEKHAPSDEQLKLIDNRLEYLSDQVSKLNRINWRDLDVGHFIAKLTRNLITIIPEKYAEIEEIYSGEIILVGLIKANKNFVMIEHNEWVYVIQYMGKGRENKND